MNDGFLPETTVDLRSIIIDRDAPAPVRREAYLAQNKTPHTFRVGEVSVTIRYAERGKCFSDILTEYISSLKDNA